MAKDGQLVFRWTVSLQMDDWSKDGQIQAAMNGRTEPEGQQVNKWNDRWVRFRHLLTDFMTDEGSISYEQMLTILPFMNDERDGRLGAHKGLKPSKSLVSAPKP